MSGTWVWNPALLRPAPPVVQLFLTYGERRCIAHGTRDFFAEVFADLEIDAEPVSWRLAPYRCRYFAEPSARMWQHRWPIAWKAHVEIAAPTTLPALAAGCHASDATDASWTLESDAQLLRRVRCL